MVCISNQIRQSRTFEVNEGENNFSADFYRPYATGSFAIDLT